MTSLTFWVGGPEGGGGGPGVAEPVTMVWEVARWQVSSVLPRKELYGIVPPSGGAWKRVAYLQPSQTRSASKC